MMKKCFLVSQASQAEDQNGINDANTGKATYDPSASGVPKAVTAMPEYMGCLTVAYGPLRMTRWPVCT